MGRLGLAMYLIDKDIIDKRHENQQAIDPELKSILKEHFAKHLNLVIHWWENVRGMVAISGVMMWWWVVAAACYVGVERIYVHFGVKVGSFPSELVMIPAMILWLVSIISIISLFMLVLNLIIMREGKKIRKVIAKVPRGAEAFAAFIESEPNKEYQEMFRSFLELPIQNTPRS